MAKFISLEERERLLAELAAKGIFSEGEPTQERSIGPCLSSKEFRQAEKGQIKDVRRKHLDDCPRCQELLNLSIPNGLPDIVEEAILRKELLPPTLYRLSFVGTVAALFVVLALLFFLDRKATRDAELILAQIDQSKRGEALLEPSLARVTEKAQKAALSQDWVKAVELYEKVTMAKPENVEIRKALVISYVKLKRYDQALKIADYSNDPDLILLSAYLNAQKSPEGFQFDQARIEKNLTVPILVAETGN